MSQEMISECEGLEESISDWSADWDWESHLAEIARQSPDELEDLVKMYYKADLGVYKIRLANTLVILNHREIIPDLISLLNLSNIYYEDSIAITLVAFNEEAGGKHLIKLHEIDPINNSANYLAETMLEYDTDVAKRYYDIFNKLAIAEKQNLKNTKS